MPALRILQAPTARLCRDQNRTSRDYSRQTLYVVRDTSLLHRPKAVWAEHPSVGSVSEAGGSNTLAAPTPTATSNTPGVVEAATRVPNCDRFSAIYLQRGMHLFAALPRMLSSLLDMATSRISGSPEMSDIRPHLKVESDSPSAGSRLPSHSRTSL